MALTIRWKVPAAITADAQASYTISVYRSTNGENGDYSSIGTTSAGGGNTVATYSDSGASQDSGYFYYVTYTASGGSEGSRVLAIPEPYVTEQRLAEQIQGKMPEIIAARLDSNLIDIRKAIRNALDIMNAYSPQTSYGFTNLPGRFESGIVILTLTLLFMEHHLQVAIRDYTYGATGINFNVDRNSKFATVIGELNKSVNELLLFLKHPDWPMDAVGLGTEALATPQARIFGFLYGSGSINP